MYTYARTVQPKFSGYMIENNTETKSFDYSSIYRSKQFQEAMRYFDNTDDLTRRVLLSVNEADQNAVMVSLSNKLYKHIVDKVDDIDFGSIPTSQGDITQIENYEQLVDCINILNDIMVNYNQPLDTINIVSTALHNLEDRIDLFTKAYKLNVEMPIIIYNTIALSIVSSVSLLISSCIEFIKLPDDQGYEIAFNKAAAIKTRENLLFSDLAKFNRVCSTGEFDKTMDFVMKQNGAKNFSGVELTIGLSGVAGVAIIIGSILLIIPIIRELIFFFYYSRAKTAEYFDIQASLLEMNAYNVENSLTRDKKTKKEIATKQRKVAENFKKIANKVRVETVSANQKAEKEVKTLDSKKYKQDEVLDKIPDSSNSVLF